MGKKERLKITLGDITERPCYKYYDYITDKYGYSADVEFDPIEVFEAMKCRTDVTVEDDVRWLLDNCEKARTPEMLEYYIKHEPDYWRVRSFIVRHEFAQTDKTIKRWLKMEPDYDDISRMIEGCKAAQTEHMMKTYMKSEPTDNDVEWLLRNCEYARENQHLIVKYGRKRK